MFFICFDIVAEGAIAGVLVQDLLIIISEIFDGSFLLPSKEQHHKEKKRKINKVELHSRKM
jgi:hypothetical protein